MTPSVDTALTKKELEVVRILRELPKLVLDAVARRLPRFLRWGTRRRRSALDDDNSLLSLPPPPPPTPTSPPPDRNDERKDGSRGNRATSNLETPLSFPASGGEEPNPRPPRPISSSVKALRNPKHGKAFKNTKQHKEWAKEQNLLTASLSDRKLHLKRVVREAMEEVGQGRMLWRDGSHGLVPSGPTSIQSSATHSMVEPHHQVYRRQMGHAVQPSLVDRKAIGGSPPMAVVAAVRREWGAEKWTSLDLNARPEKEKWGMEEKEWEQQPSSTYKAAMSAQARKRRLEILREKNSYSSRNQKKSRLR